MAWLISFGSTSRKPKCATPPTAPAMLGSSVNVKMSCLPTACVWIEAIPTSVLTETKDLFVEPQGMRSVPNTARLMCVRPCVRTIVALPPTHIRGSRTTRGFTECSPRLRVQAPLEAYVRPTMFLTSRRAADYHLNQSSRHRSSRPCAVAAIRGDRRSPRRGGTSRHKTRSLSWCESPRSSRR
jgi:hypothetical protein